MEGNGEADASANQDILSGIPGEMMSMKRGFIFDCLFFSFMPAIEFMDGKILGSFTRILEARTPWGQADKL